MLRCYSVLDMNENALIDNGSIGECLDLIKTIGKEVYLLDNMHDSKIKYNVLKIENLSRNQRKIIKENKWHNLTGFIICHNKGNYDLYIDLEMFQEDFRIEIKSKLGIEVA